MNELIFPVTCPYCGEPGEIYLEPDVEGQLVQDCEVCCNPWLVEITRGDSSSEESFVQIRRADGSE
jgi:Cysteine-rich CPXCG